MTVVCVCVFLLILLMSLTLSLKSKTWLLVFVPIKSHDLCANLLELCREYQTLRTRISSVIERAHAITVAQSDPHNPEDIRRALSRVSASVCASF